MKQELYIFSLTSLRSFYTQDGQTDRQDARHKLVNFDRKKKLLLLALKKKRVRRCRQGRGKYVAGSHSKRKERESEREK